MPTKVKKADKKALREGPAPTLTMPTKSEISMKRKAAPSTKVKAAKTRSGYQPEGSRRYRTIHAGDRQLARSCRPASKRLPARLRGQRTRREGRSRPLTVHVRSHGVVAALSGLLALRPAHAGYFFVKNGATTWLVTGWTADEWASSSPPAKARRPRFRRACPAPGSPI